MMSKVIQVEVKPKYPHEPLDKMIKRLNKKVKKERLMEKVLEKRFYEKPSVRRRKEKKYRKKILEKLHKQKQPSNHK